MTANNSNRRLLPNVLEKVKTALRVVDVLNAHVDALGDEAVLDALVDNDTDGTLGHVVDAACKQEQERKERERKERPHQQTAAAHVSSRRWVPL